jgi:hypothetical protein
MFFSKMQSLTCVSLAKFLCIALYITATTAQSTYWLGNKPARGKVAFQDPTYPVFRNVKDYGAVGERGFRIC